MKVLNYTGIIIAASLTAASSKAEDVTNRFSFSARMGFNISAKFQNRVVAPPARTTPDGSSYNYDDGYILDDSSGSFGGMTWNWGYDNSAQIDTGNNTVALSRSTGASTSPTEKDDFSPGAELVYNRQFGERDNVRYGIELAGNFLNIGINGNQNLNRVTDLYSYVPGTTPPANPYQGTFTGPGFVIFTNISSSITSSISERQKFDGDLWGFRLGPYLEIPLSERVNLNVIGGLAFGFLDAEVSWRQNGLSLVSGREHDSEFLWGGYVGGNLSWQFAEDWSLIGGAHYQSLGNYAHSFAGRKVKVQLRNTVFVTLGVGYTF